MKPQRTRSNKVILYILVLYVLIGFAYAFYVQVKADPNDPPPVPIWAPGLSLVERAWVFLIYFVPAVLCWPVFLPPTIWWCFIKHTC